MSVDAGLWGHDLFNNDDDFTDDTVAAEVDTADAAEADAGRKRVMRPPGVRFQTVAEFLFSRTAYKTIFEPILRDLQDEHIEALAAFEKTGERLYLWKARWVVLRGKFSFWAALVAYLNGNFVRWLINLAKPS